MQRTRHRDAAHEIGSYRKNKEDRRMQEVFD